MPYAETSRVRQLRLEHGLTIAELAQLAGLSVSVVKKVEYDRNRANIARLKAEGKRVPLTTIEVVVRLAAALGLIDYNTTYSIDEVGRMQKLIFKKYISQRPARCKHAFPGNARRLARVARITPTGRRLASVA